MSTGPTGSLPVAPLAAEAPAKLAGLPFRLGLFVLFLACSLIIFVLGSSYYTIFPTNQNTGFQAAVTVALLAAALLLKRQERLKKYWPVAFAFSWPPSPSSSPPTASAGPTR